MPHKSSADGLPVLNDHRALPTYFENIEKDDDRGSPPKRPLPFVVSGLSSLRAARRFGVATAFSRARGNNAVVLKVLSYGAGVRSARNVLAYLAKEERAVDQHGHEVADVNRTIEEWSQEFKGRAGSKDILILRYLLTNASGDRISKAMMRIGNEGLHDDQDTERSLAYSAEPAACDQMLLTLAIIIAPEKHDRADRHKEGRLKPTEDARERIHRNIERYLGGEGIVVALRKGFETTTGRKGMSDALRSMGRRGAAVTISTKTYIKYREGKIGEYERGSQRRTVVTNNHREISRESAVIASLMSSQQSRDFMHLLISAPADTDRDNFIKAGAAFLQTQFAGHRYAYAIHNRNEARRHPHLHVIVAMNDGHGKRLDPNIRDFSNWRVCFAEKAREHGIKLEPQKRTDRAAPPAIKRWEWELFRRLGMAAPPTLAQKVCMKLFDRPTAPRLAAARVRFETTRRNLIRVIELLDELSRDRNGPSTARELSKELHDGLSREYQRLECTLHDRRNPILERNAIHETRIVYLSRSQADSAKEHIARRITATAALIQDPVDRSIFTNAGEVINRLARLQLDARINEVAVARTAERRSVICDDPGTLPGHRALPTELQGLNTVAKKIGRVVDVKAKSERFNAGENLKGMVPDKDHGRMIAKERSRMR